MAVPQIQGPEGSMEALGKEMEEGRDMEVLG